MEVWRVMKRGNNIYWGERVIDFVIGDVEVEDKIKKLKVGDKIDSDHQPVEVEIEGEDRSWRRDRKGEKRWRGI